MTVPTCCPAEHDAERIGAVVRVYLAGDDSQVIYHQHADGTCHDDDTHETCWSDTVPAGTWAPVQ